MKNSDLAKLVDEAALNANPIPQLTTHRDISLEDAYDIQTKSIQERYRRGEKFIGYKMGFTSKAKMEQMGVHEIIWGRLTDKMLINRGGQINIHKYIHPRAEPEICFLVKKKITKPITSTAILMLYEQGLLHLKDTIQKFIPDFPYRKITIENLLTQKSGRFYSQF